MDATALPPRSSSSPIDAVRSAGVPARRERRRRWSLGLGGLFVLSLFTGCQTQPGLGTLGGAGAGVAVGSMVGSGRGRTAAMVGGGLLGAAAGNQLVDRPVADANAARREAERDREWQRRLDFEREAIIERDRAQREIEERRLFEEWKRSRGT